MKSLTLTLNGTEVPIIFDKFPGGETLVRIEDKFLSGTLATCIITLNFRGNTDLIDLLLLTDAIRRRWPHDGTQIHLVMPYFPYARQDRVCSQGESLSAKVIANLINSQNYATVTCKDLHSDVSGALLNNLRHKTLLDCASRLGELGSNGDTVLVSPDAGANKKVFEFAKAYYFNDVIRADKTRDPKTGKITGTQVFSEHIGSKDFLILDDICDGGRTFIELAKVLRPLTNGKIILYVTHGIFSKGIGVFDGIIDRIYVSNLMTEETNQLIYTI